MKMRTKTKKAAALLSALLLALSAVSCGPANGGQEETGTVTDGTVRETSAGTAPAETGKETGRKYEEGWASTRPCVVHPRFPSEDPVIADVIASDDFGADPTGKSDSTEAIRQALAACAEQGGGTVFLPAGTYLITEGITVPSGTVLRGDWCDPETGDTEDPGTVLLAEPEPAERGGRPEADPLLTVSSNAGLIGLTVWYPEQDPSAPVPYGYTVRVGTPEENAATALLRNLTLINSYYGVWAADAHEMLRTSGLRICALKKGFVTDRSSDVGFTDDLSVSSDYWEYAGGAYGCPDPVALSALLREEGSAVELGQTDDETLSRIRIRGYRTGITVFAPFWGLISGLRITDCGTGVDVRSLNPYAGLLIADGEISAETAVVSTASCGAVRLSGVKTAGTVTGDNVRINGETAPLPGITVRSMPEYAEELTVVGAEGYAGTKKDLSVPLQEALDAAKEKGGTVLLPAGVYSLYRPVTVPEGVLLRGSVPFCLRDGTDTAPGTVILSYVSEESTFTLRENAGLCGLRLFFPAYDPVTAGELIRADDPRTRVPAVRGEGKNVCLNEVGITAAFIGADVSGCDGHLVRGVFGCCYLTQTAAGGKGGEVSGCLQNMTFTQRHALSRYFDPEYASPTRDWMGLGAYVRDLVLRPYCTALTLRGAENETVRNLFAYAAAHLISVTDSAARITNVSSDFMYGEEFVLRNSRVTVFNTLHSCGGSVLCEGTEAEIRNRLAIGDLYQPDFTAPASDPMHPDVRVIPTAKRQITACETAEGLKYASLNTDPALTAEGGGSWTVTHKPHEASRLLEASFAPVSVSGYEADGFLHVSLYVSEYVNLLWGGSMTLCSEGGGSLSWSLPAYLTRTGWNEVFLPFDSAIRTGNFRPEKVNGFRVNGEFGADFVNVFAFDDLYICKSI